MLKSIKIKNFKSVQDLEIELGRVNVFIGENGCGKTSILEAIGMGTAAFSNELNQSVLFNKGIRVTEGNLMRSAFDTSKGNTPIHIGLTNQAGNNLAYDIAVSGKSFEINKAYSNIDEQEPRRRMYEEILGILNKNKRLQKEIASELNKRKKTNQVKEDHAFIEKKFQEDLEIILKSSIDLDNDSNYWRKYIYLSNNRTKLEGFDVDDYMIYTPENHFLRRFEDEGQILPIGKQGEGLFKHLVELFKNDDSFAEDICKQLKLINWFDGLEIPSDLAFTEMRLNIKDRFIKENIEYFDQRSANEGFLYLLFYFTLFLSKETPRFFAVDNIDNALNPKLCRELINRLTELAKEKKKQVILTTHNPAILDGLDLKDDEQRLFVVYRNADGHTKAKRVPPPKDIDGIETVRLSEAFIRGYIGGLPKNF
ncbi:AAA family ATPase [Pedobacter heparinus]|uniref:SMC domain protein n=1 Tax=Pedobacter heparinus (strain ATCC 13125 / DSM 2366 / CIP 104194 / JCM 7457 / NBRC 12017 / NCIMB 9290 / NRRL B-14731 / HIM 762-3) TaxID=485917 RepID=C6Y1Q8_PEDHD|nr:AAA family ATPase [Pedobacter heparinus]ACU05050.1 SMC domain protein [Pedobacter heparinus DSM 2366]